MRSRIALAGLAVALAACGSDGGSSGTVYTQAGTQITVASGKEFTIELEATPSTGYTWQLSQPPGDQVTLVDADYQQGDNQPGASGQQRFVFRGAAPGSTTLTFSYLRPWEQGVPAADTVVFPVTVT